MDTIKRLNDLLAERNMSLYRMAKECRVSYSSLRRVTERNGQLRVKTIEKICKGLNMPLYEFFQQE